MPITRLDSPASDHTSGVVFCNRSEQRQQKDWQPSSAKEMQRQRHKTIINQRANRHIADGIYNVRRGFNYAVQALAIEERASEISKDSKDYLWSK